MLKGILDMNNPTRPINACEMLMSALLESVRPSDGGENFIIPADRESFEKEQCEAGFKQTAASREALDAFANGYGVGIIGAVGTGKTFFFVTLPRTPAYSRRGYCGETVPRVWLNPVELAGKTLGQVMDRMRMAMSAEMIIDDIGAEPTLSDYGSRLEIMPLIIDARTQATARTFFTTNLTPKELQDKYGVRTVDRIFQMCKCVTFDGESCRKPRPNSYAVRGIKQARDFAVAMKKK